MTLEAAARDLLEDLVSAYSPSGEEEQAADVLLEHLETLGLAAHKDAMGNVHATPSSDPPGPPSQPAPADPSTQPDPASSVPGRVNDEAGGDPTVLMLGHIDTVPGQLPVAWDGDVLAGRGTVDAKGPLVAHALALASLPPDIGLDVRLVGAVGEEAHGRGARHIRDTLQAPDGLLIAEPTGHDTIALGYKGRLLARITANARPTHPGAPSPTASERLIDALETLTAHTGNPDRDVGFDQTTLRITDLQTTTASASEQAQASIDVRFPGQPPDLEEAANLDASIQVQTLEAMPGVRSEPRSSLATAFRGTLRGREVEPRTVLKTGTSDWNILAQAWRCPGLAYGPGDPELDHTPDEHIEISAILEAAEVVQESLQRLAKRGIEGAASSMSS